MASRRFDVLTMAVIALVIIDAAGQPLMLLDAWLDPDGFRATIGPIARVVDTSAAALKWATMLSFACWIYAAGRNLDEAGIEDLAFTPAARVWWFFVPVAALYKPFQGMRELHNASRDIRPHDARAPLVTIWWAMWLASSISSWIVLISSGQVRLPLLAIQYAIIAVRAPFAIAILLKVRAGQRDYDRAALHEVFA